MINKSISNNNFNKKNSEDPDIEYNDDFTSEKTKSLNKFPLKLITSDEFYLGDLNKNFSKSLS